MNAYILDAVRTPRATLRKGTSALAQVKPVDLVATLLRALVDRGLDPATVDDVILGCSTQVGDQGANIAKTALLCAGYPDAVPGMTVTRLCISGLEAIALAAAKVIAGHADLVIAGGVESMSRVPMMSDKGAWFADPDVAKRARFVHMGVAADLIATQDERTRSDLDAVAIESHARAAKAAPTRVIAIGELTKDDGVRDTAKFPSLPAAFGELNPEITRQSLHTVATSPQMADGASLVVVSSREGLARIASYQAISTDPVTMLTGTASATRRALAKANRSVSDVAVFEHNESFAATHLRYQKDLAIDASRVNPWGGALALGHPLGATGGMLVTDLLDELAFSKGTTGVVSICAGAGLASALVLTR